MGERSQGDASADDADGGEPTWRELVGDGRLWTTLILCLGLWLNAADALVVSTIMPSVAKDIGGFEFFSWATAGFMLGSILAGAVAGFASTKVGLRLALSGAAAVYVAGCVASALAPAIGFFLAGRLLQGIGAGFIIGLCYVAVRAAYPHRLWALTFSVLSGVWGVATLLGPLIGGLLAQAHLWRWVFWFFAAQATLFAVLAFRLPASADPDEAAREGLPAAQLLVLATAVSLIAAAAAVKSLPLAGATALGGCAMLGLAVRLDGRAATRLLAAGGADLGQLSGRGYASVLCLSLSAASFSVYAVALLQARLHLGPLAAGYIAASESIGWTLTALVAARLPDGARPYMIRLGPALIALGLAACAWTIAAAGAPLIVASGLVMGSGFGFCWSFISQAVLSAVDDDDASVASAALPTIQLLGGALGAAAAGVLANALGLGAGFKPGAVPYAAPILLGAFVPLALVGLVAIWRLGDAKGELSSAH